MLAPQTLGLLSQHALQGMNSPLQTYETSAIPLRQLNDTVCPALTDQFAGSIALPHGKDLFYCSHAPIKVLDCTAILITETGLFKSASDPDNDPTVVWLSGGPGAGSTFAAVTEVGPCRVNWTDNSTYHNPHHWAKNANLLLLDQPAGAGFSSPSPDPGHRVKTLEQATEDFVSFMHQFMTDVLPQLSKSTLHIAAESYGGRWAPFFMHRLKSLAEIKSPYALPNPLGSMILVDAVIGAIGGDLSSAYYEFGCSPSGSATKLGFGFNSTICDLIQEHGPTCEFYATLCESTDSIAVCKDATNYCRSHISDHIPLQSRNMYNVAQPCTYPEDLCIQDWKAAVNFYNQSLVKEAMGVQDRTWTPVSYDIVDDFMESGASAQSIIPKLKDILNSGTTRVLVMNGDLDSLVITEGQIRIFDKLPWRGQVDFRQQPWRDWVAEDDVLGISRGRVKNSTSLTFATFEKAGHMVPGDDPLGASVILSEWLRHENSLSDDV